MRLWTEGKGWRLFRVTRGTALAVLRKRWLELALLVLASLAVGVLATTFANLLSHIVNDLGRGMGPSGPFSPIIEPNSRDSDIMKVLLRDTLLSTPVGALAGCAILALAILALALITSRVRATLSAEVYQRLRTEAFERCFDDHEAVEAELRAANADDANRPVGLASALNRGASAVSDTYTYALNSSQQIISLATAAFTAGGKNLPITAACAAVILVQIVVARLQAGRLKARRQAFDETSNRLQGRTAELLAFRELLLAFDKSDQYKQVLRDLVGEVADLQRRNETSEARYSAVYDLVQKWGQLAVIGLAGLLAISFPIPLAPDESSQPLIFALTLYGSLLPSAQSLIGAYDSMKRTEAVVGSFVSLIGMAPTRAGARRKQAWMAGQPIVFDNVTFAHDPAGRPTFDGLSIEIPAGRTTLILGPSGCGKTTIGRMALGFLSPRSGEVRIGGGAVKDWAADYLLGFMSYAPQNDHVLDTTVAENLRLAEGARALSERQLVAALELVKLRGEGGAASQLSRRAKELSGGEIQRLSAARILLDHSEIVILDEPMAGVDVFTMADIAPAIESHWRKTGQTVVLISHKLVFASVAEWIIILDPRGVPIEQGEPETLLARPGGVYAGLRAEALRQAGGC